MNIAIIGAGYVGLPLATAFAKYYSVVCYDVNQTRVLELLKGIDSNKQHSKKDILNKNLVFTDDPNLLKKMDTYIIAVPTPINLSNQPDLRMLEQASLLVGKYIKKNSTIIYESICGNVDDWKFVSSLGRLVVFRDIFVFLSFA